MNEFQVFKKLIKENPSFGGYIILTSVVDFYKRKYNLRETLEDLHDQPGINKKQIEGLLERIDKENISIVS